MADSYPWGRLSGLAYSLDPFSLYPALSPPFSHLLPSFLPPTSPFVFVFIFVTLCNGLQAHWARYQMAIRWMASGSILSSQKRLLRGRMRAHPPWGRQWWEIQQTAEVRTEGIWVGGSWKTSRRQRRPRKGRQQHGLSSSARGSLPFPLS